MTSVKPPRNHGLNQTVEPWSDQKRWCESRTNWTVVCAKPVGMFLKCWDICTNNRKLRQATPTLPHPLKKQCRLTLSKTKLAREAHKNARTFQLFSERMKERGSRSTQTCKPCTWWRYQVGMSVEVCSHNYSVKPKRSNVSKPNHWSRLTGVKPQLNECISRCFCRLVNIRPMSYKGMLEVAWSTHRMRAALKHLNVCSSMTTADGEKLLDHLLLLLLWFFFFTF